MIPACAPGRTRAFPSPTSKPPLCRYSDDRAGEVALARRFATRGVELDPIDPFVNFAMGRTFWLEGDLESSLGWLERATSISPNYAQGIYARAWTESIAGRALEARNLVDLAMRLSPLDPLYYAMLGTRAFTHTVLGEDLEAVDWAERAARSPGAHVLIALIAVAMNALAENHTRAAWWAENVRSRNPALTRDDFFRAFPMRSEAIKARMSTPPSALPGFKFRFLASRIQSRRKDIARPFQRYRNIRQGLHTLSSSMIPGHKWTLWPD